MVGRRSSGWAAAGLLGVVGCGFDSSGWPLADADSEQPLDSTSTTGSGSTDAGLVSTSTGEAPPPAPAESTDEGAGTSSSGGSSSTGPEPETPLCDAEDPALIGCYAFDDVEGGTVVDGSSHHNDGTLVNGVVEASPYGTAVVFSADTRLEIPDSSSLDVTTGLAIEAWVRRDAEVSWGRQGLLDNDGQYGLFVHDDGTIRCSVVAAIASADAPPVGRWSHVACVVHESTVTVYVDGVPGPSEPFVGPLQTGNVEPMSIGDSSPGWDEPLTGALASVRIWNDGRIPTPPRG